MSDTYVDDEDFVDDEPPVVDDEPVDESRAQRESRARRLGWHPLAEFRGKPEDWRDADEFLAVGEAAAPVMRANNNRLHDLAERQDRELNTMRQTVAEQAAKLEELTLLAQRADKRGYDRAMAELRERRAEAVETGDSKAFAQFDEQMETLRTEFHAAPPKRETPPPTPPLDPAYPEFFAANPWFNSDTTLKAAMIAAHNLVMVKHPAMDLREQLKQAKDRVIEEFPAKFGRRAVAPQPPEEDDDDMPIADRPRTRAAVARPSGAPQGDGRSRRPTGIDAITDPDERRDAKSAFASAKRQDPDLPESEWLEIYNNPHADPLELRRQRKKS